ncbi:beta-propeller fold lactonase family protein [Pontibacter sp. E15-1]|uniref:beta-propeller fold lactonase family protein n=1 Tax=Pontibacter sp. E15-1 TaxID=2919918 RepID=UPI00397A73D1
MWLWVNEREDYEDRESGAVCSFHINRQTGCLTLLNRVPSLGSLPVYIAAEHSGNAVIVANNKSGNVAVFPELENGKLADASDLSSSR